MAVWRPVCEVSGYSQSDPVGLTLAPSSDRIPVELFQILKDDAVESVRDRLALQDGTGDFP